MAVLLPAYFLLTGFAVTGPHAPLRCASTLTELGRDRSTTADPSGACHAGAVDRLHLAIGYASASVAVAALVGCVAGFRQRALNRAWASERVPSRWLSTPGQVWLLAGLLFVVFAGFAQGL